MFTRKLTVVLYTKLLKTNLRTVQQRNVQVSLIGAGSDIGTQLSALLKQNSRITKLILHDGEERVKGIAMELNNIPEGPMVSAYSGDENLVPAIAKSKLIVLVTGAPRKSGFYREQMLDANAPSVQKLCKAMIERNPDAFLAISANPVNSIIPFASAILFKYNSYNPFKVFGITHIDSARCRSFAGSTLGANPRHLYVPVIGGHSEDTVVPLFSNLLPNSYCVDAHQADMLTRLVKKAGCEVINHKQGCGASTLAMAWSINEFVEAIVKAIGGGQQNVHCFSANPHFGTRFFAGPVTVGPFGIFKTGSNYNMTNFEAGLLSNAVPSINRDVMAGEDYARLLRV